LAYLSKYPHVRQAIYKPRTLLGVKVNGTLIETPLKTAGTFPCPSDAANADGKEYKEGKRDLTAAGAAGSLLKALGVGKKGRDKEKVKLIHLIKYTI
jgi:hypothetical protein